MFVCCVWEAAFFISFPSRLYRILAASKTNIVALSKTNIVALSKTNIVALRKTNIVALRLPRSGVWEIPHLS